MHRGEGHAPGLARGAVAAGHGQRREMSCVGEAGCVAREKLPTPDRAVAAVSRAVEYHADRLALVAALGETGGEMRVMMLHRHSRQLREALRRGSSETSLRPLAAEVVRMQVMSDGHGFDAVDVEQMRQGFLEETKGLEVFQVADVLGEKGGASLRHAQRVFQFGSDGDHRGRLVREQDGTRHVAAGAADGTRLARDHAEDRVVAALQDLAVVMQEAVGDLREALLRIVDVRRDGLLAHIAAGHHQRVAVAVEQEVVQGRVRQHHAERGVAERHRRRDAVTGPAREDDRGTHSSAASSSVTWQTRRTASRSRSITARGFA